MALDFTALFPSFSGCGGNVKELNYTTTDTLSTVSASGYFNGVSTLINVGDIISVSVVDAVNPNTRTAVVDTFSLSVATNTGGVVTTRPRDISRNLVKQFDDFDGAVISSKFGVNKGSDGAAVNFAVSVDTSGKVLATTGAGAGASMAANGVQLHSALNFKANQGGLVFEARMKISAITNISVFVGLTNQTASLQAPIIGSGAANTLTNNAADAVGFVFDTAMTTADIWQAGVATSVGATAQDSLLAFVADTYRTLRIELTTAGAATFFIDGVLKGTAMTGAVTATVALTPVITAFTRSAASATVSVDYVFVQAVRA